MTESIELNTNEVERLRRALEEQTHRTNQAEGRLEQQSAEMIQADERHRIEMLAVEERIRKVCLE